MYLVDTNIWLERLLGQERTDIVGKFLNLVPSEHLYITDFSFHSIGVILSRLKMGSVFLEFIEDIFQNGDVKTVILNYSEITEEIKLTDLYNLDFDDSYQYVAAVNTGLSIVSFDKDFDKTKLGRISPEKLINHL
jgi:predicted nucleic acid-binding protein